MVVKFLKSESEVKVQMNMIIKNNAFIQKGKVTNIKTTPMEHNLAYGISECGCIRYDSTNRTQSKTEQTTEKEQFNKKRVG